MGNVLYYTPPIPPKTPFVKGETVNVMSRDHKILGTAVISVARKTLVWTADGRRWRRDGYWLGDRAYPFPWIQRPSEAAKNRKAAKSK